MAEKTVEAPSYLQRLSQALKQRLPGADVHHEQIRGDQYRFITVWDGFDGMDHPERQEIVWDVVEQTLSKPDLLKVGMILTMGLEDLPPEE